MNSIIPSFVSSKQQDFGTIIDVSLGVCSNSGYLKNELIGKNLNVLLPEMFRSAHHQLIKTKIEEYKQKEIDEKGNNKHTFKTHVSYLLTKAKFIIPVVISPVILTNESNTQFISQLTTINNSLNEFREHQLEANEINEKTIVCLGDQMVSLLKVIKALESNKEETDENFEEIQNGFDKVENIIIKVPKIEKDYLLLNEFIVELTKKYQELNIKIDTGLNNVTEWESGLVENITNKMNEIIDDYEKKIMKTSQQIQSSRTETTDIRIDPKKADNSINDKSANNISNIGGFDFDN